MPVMHRFQDNTTFEVYVTAVFDEKKLEAITIAMCAF